MQAYFEHVTIYILSSLICFQHWHIHSPPPNFGTPPCPLPHALFCLRLFKYLILCITISLYKLQIDLVWLWQWLNSSLFCFWDQPVLNQWGQSSILKDLRGSTSHLASYRSVTGLTHYSIGPADTMHYEAAFMWAAEVLSTYSIYLKSFINFVLILTKHNMNFKIYKTFLFSADNLECCSLNSK